MLVLSRKKSQEIQIGPDIRIVVIRIGGEKVRIGIDAPDYVSITRPDMVEKEPPKAEL